MSQELLKVNALDELVEGYTNVPLASHDGAISEDALKCISTELEQRRAFKKEKNSVLRVDPEKGVVDYITRWSLGGELGFEIDHIDHYQFSLDGKLIGKESGRTFNVVDLCATILTAGIYALGRWQLPSVKRNAKISDKLHALYSQLQEANQQDANRIASSVPVYLGDVGDVERITRRTVESVKIPTPFQYVSGGHEESVQIAAHLLGANAIVNYQRASPSRGTPVLLK